MNISVISLWVRALTYMLVVGGGWLVVMPGTILYFEHGTAWPALSSLPFLIFGSAAFLGGAALALFAGYHLIAFGDGTPFPLDPTQRLVTSGPYQCVRNPQAVAMLSMTVGVVLSVSSAMLWLMLPLTLIYLEGIVGPLEERALEREFGDEYLVYKKRVRKWVPYRNRSGKSRPT